METPQLGAFLAKEMPNLIGSNSAQTRKLAVEDNKEEKGNLNDSKMDIELTPI